jgi:hypothetical protein
MLLSLFAAAFTFAAFVVAGGFSATISSSTGREVLLGASKCGWIPFLSSQGPNTTVLFADQARRPSNLANYAQQCYSSEGSGSLNCETFINPSLPYTTNTKASCPFQDSICKSKTDNLYIDSGFIDSNKHLGLNAPAEDNVRMRTTFHCAPMTTKSYSSSLQYKKSNYTGYHYGSFTELNSAGNLSTMNYTYLADSLSSQYRKSNPAFTPSHSNYVLRYVYTNLLCLVRVMSLSSSNF